MARDWSGPTFEVRTVFRAPLGFVYRWCTDYTPEDSRYEAEDYRRRILRRSSREVVFEDLEDTKDGWVWSRHVVHLRPPNRWSSSSVGSHRVIELDYRLSPLPGNRTQLTLTARRRPYGIGPKNPPQRQWERSVGRAWRRFALALERDYQRSVVRRRAK